VCNSELYEKIDNKQGTLKGTNLMISKDDGNTESIKGHSYESEDVKEENKWHY